MIFFYHFYKRECISILQSQCLLIDKTGFGGMGKWDRNHEEFRRRFDPEFTYGEGPARLKNLYFLYLLELTAIAKAAPYLENEKFYTGNLTEDLDVKDAINDILKLVKYAKCVTSYLIDITPAV